MALRTEASMLETSVAEASMLEASMLEASMPEASIPEVSMTLMPEASMVEAIILSVRFFSVFFANGFHRSEFHLVVDKYVCLLGRCSGAGHSPTYATSLPMSTPTHHRGKHVAILAESGLVYKAFLSQALSSMLLHLAETMSQVVRGSGYPAFFLFLLSNVGFILCN